MRVSHSTCVKVREQLPKSLLFPLALWGPGDKTTVVRFGDKQLYPRTNNLTQGFFFFFLIPVFLGCHMIIFWLTEFLKILSSHVFCF